MHKRGGFSLLEVLVAMLILGIGIMAVMQLFPPSLYQARLATERVPTAAKANQEFGVLRAWGLSPTPATVGAVGPGLPWPVSAGQENEYGEPADGVANTWGTAYMQYNIQLMGIPSMDRAACVYSLYRVTLAVPMSDGRYEKFVTYMSQY